LGAQISWKETAEEFRTSWDKVHDAVEYLVTRGLEHRVLGAIRAIGVDEMQRGKGHKYLTLVYQIDLGCTRLLWVSSVVVNTTASIEQLPSALDDLTRSSI
jgi:transposase